MTTFQTTCRQCQNIFEASRSTAQFCGSTCRTHAADTRTRAAFIRGLRARLTPQERNDLAAYLAPSRALLPASLTDLTDSDLAYVADLSSRMNVTPFSTLCLLRYAQRTSAHAHARKEILPTLKDPSRA